jgi:alpha-tubulin suppressor-like RCC1 family protein
MATALALMTSALTAVAVTAGPPASASTFAPTISTGIGPQGCSIRGGLAYCWGAGAGGQLGNNSTAQSDVPVAVSTSGALSGVTITEISAGLYSVCALSSAGAVYCWGYNADGELGDSSTTQSDVPVAVSTSGVLSGKTITQVSAGLEDACALASTGAAYCWGDNATGQLGNSSTTSSSVPVAVTTSGALSGKTLASISAGPGATCAVDTSGLAYCWGYNGPGQLGNGNTTQQTAPVAVSTSGVLSGVTLAQVSVGFATTCAVSSAGAAYCWGYNTDGELGNNASGAASSVPVAVYAGGVLSGVTLTQIAAGLYFTCAQDAAGNTYCWGQNGSGQLGNASTTGSDVPVKASGPVTAPTGVHAFPASTSAAVYWTAVSGAPSGETLSGYTATASPGGATCTTATTTCTITGLSNGTTYTITVVTNTSLSMSAPSTSATVTPWPPATAIGAGYPNTCTLQSGKAYCWGDNTDGEAGNGTTTTPQLSPVAVATSGVLSGVTLTQVITGVTFGCGLSSAGKAYCWGDNSYGELGNGSGAASSDVPVAVSTSGVLSGVTLTEISTERYSVCALSNVGQVYCWGDDTNGQLGNGTSGTTSNVPVAVTTSGTPMAGVTLVQVSAGWLTSCALGSNAAVYCWGDNSYAELGDDNSASSDVPVAVYTGGVLSGVPIASISAGWVGACALSTAGAAYCWGYNYAGELGDGNATSIGSTSDVPVAVTDSGVLSGVTLTQVSDGLAQVCALSTAGAAYCWGDNNAGQLGDNSTTDTTVPVAVTTSGALSGVTLTQVSAGVFYTCTLSGAGTSYCFGLGTDGELGNNSSSTNSPVAVVVTPQAPLSVTATAGNTTLPVSWTAPAYLNTGTLTGYTATASPGGATCTATSTTSCTLTGLTDGTSYTITVTTTATVSGTSQPSIAATGTPAGLELTAPATLTWTGTMTGDDQSIVDAVSGDQQLTVNDASGTMAGWHVTLSATTFTGGTRTLPDSDVMDVTGSTTSPTATTAPSTACVSSCTLPANTTSYPVLISAAGSPVTIYHTASGTGVGAVTIGGSSATYPLGWWVEVPGNSYAGTYTSTITLSLVSGP